MVTYLPPALGQTPLLRATAGNWHTWGTALEGVPGASLALPTPLPKPRGSGRASANEIPPFIVRGFKY